jgi:CheY-like chemotaxis protein
MAGNVETPPPKRRLRVLVVDDNQDAADSLGTLLGLWGYDYRVAYDGTAGWEAACAYRPDCLLLDIRMPGLDGYALARRVRQHPELKEAKLVALTAYSDDAHALRAEEAGFDYRLVKTTDPSEVERLLDMLSEIMQLAGRTEQLAQKSVTLSSETKQLLKEVREDIKEVKEEVKELREELREVQGGGKSPGQQR